MRAIVPALAIALLATLVLVTSLPFSAASSNTSTINGGKGKGFFKFCNCTEWACPRHSKLSCPPGPKCKHGSCWPVVAPDGSGCKLNNKCEVGPGSCKAGICVGKYQKVCPVHPEQCKLFVCSPATGKCNTVGNKPDGTSCKGGSCYSGICLPTPTSPSPSPAPCTKPRDPCKVNVTNPSTGKCEVSNAGDGKTCSDSNKCTTNDVCKRGVCTGTPRRCTRPSNPCKQSACNPLTGRCVTSNVPDGTICPNGTCTLGICTDLNPESCPIIDDPCKQLVFDPELQECVEAPANEGRTCDDGLRCTTDDKCTAGVCVGTPKVCTVNGNPCKTGKCNPFTGECVDENVEDSTTCDDDLFCTVEDVCMSGLCTGKARQCPASTDQCAQAVCDEAANQCTFGPKPDGSQCDVASTGRCTSDTCVAGVCTVANATDCSGLNDVCNTGVCDTVTGECQKSPRPEGTVCEDGLFCTMDTTCKAGVCQGGKPRPCPVPPIQTCGGTTAVCIEELDQCKIITTNPCKSLDDQCNVGVCDPISGNCMKMPANNGKTCDDGLFCTQNDVCDNGQCTGRPRACPDTGLDQCRERICDESTNQCREVDKANGFPCDTGTGQCSKDTCQAGICTAGPTTDCSAFDRPCRRGVCSPSTGKCEAQNINGGQSCDDGNFCTIDTVCVEGACTGGKPRICTPNNRCETATCNVATQSCTSTPVNCSSFNDQCKTGVCNPANGLCEAKPANAGATCTVPGLFCIVDTKCQADGSCGGGTPRDCSSAVTGCQRATCNELDNKCDVINVDCSLIGNECNEGLCGLNGQCFTRPLTGNKCDDGNPATCSSTCNNGVCVGSSSGCPPATCTTDTSCGANQCCCGGTCTPKLGNDCQFTCADQDCNKEGKAQNLICHCIKDCGNAKGNAVSYCSSVGGNPCKSNGVCCCAKAKPPGITNPTYEDACPACRTGCEGGNQCTGDLPLAQEAAICAAPFPPKYP